MSASLPTACERPHEVVKAGDVVKVRVVEVDVARKRIGLTMRKDSSDARESARDRAAERLQPPKGRQTRAAQCQPAGRWIGQCLCRCAERQVRALKFAARGGGAAPHGLRPPRDIGAKIKAYACLFRSKYPAGGRSGAIGSSPDRHGGAKAPRLPETSRTRVRRRNRPPSARQSAARAGPRPPAPIARPCRNCRYRDQASCHCRWRGCSSAQWRHPRSAWRPDRSADLAVLHAIGLGAAEDELAAGDIDLPAAEAHRPDAILQIGDHACRIGRAIQHGYWSACAASGYGQNFRAARCRWGPRPSAGHSARRRSCI